MLCINSSHAAPDVKEQIECQESAENHRVGRSPPRRPEFGESRKPTISREENDDNNGRDEPAKVVVTYVVP